jgi:phosphoribosyl-AMP cyclohydrolase
MTHYNELERTMTELPKHKNSPKVEEELCIPSYTLTKGKLIISLTKRSDITLMFSVVMQHPDLYSFASLAFKHGRVRISAHLHPDLRFTHDRKRVEIWLRGRVSAHNTNVSILKLDTKEERDAVYVEIIEALNAFAENGYFNYTAPVENNVENLLVF